ncbi:glycoprotein [Cardamom vein clearing nucleorhabdovirus 1]|uniref:Glycoprotein n=1 Tax=cardamom vein clearing virus TaxID=2849749 RepID=A0A6M6R7W4_9RHAB|nr:glycoprotein [Cardamom vein clearing nucleorhabdovirus 1]QJZ27983.1 glycoprotein [Cardamom vein clearing nucleorhabdovirus 1]
MDIQPLQTVLVSICFIAFVFCSTMEGSDDTQEDKFAWKKAEAKKENPTYKVAGEIGYGGDLYQPYYVCGNIDDKGGMPLSAWHYSCKQSCVEQNKRQKINITRVRWDFTGPIIHTYKVVTNRVCYTSHVNVWGHCSQSQTITPVPTEESDRERLPPDMLTTADAVPGTVNIQNSGEAECNYFSDNTRCGRDYKIMYREGKLIQKSDDAPLLLAIYRDGIKTTPSLGTLKLNDAIWFWNPPSSSLKIPCGWVGGADLSCSFTDSAEIMKCDEIGYTYNIQTLVSKKTCLGTIYDVDGPAPFIYKSREYYDTRSAILEKAIKDKGDADVAMIKGINYAMLEMETTYCSAMCDVFARSPGGEEDHVLDTPIGTWKMDLTPNKTPKMIPCQATSSWRLQNPTTLCHGGNHLLVNDSVTGHTNSWNVRKDYIVLDEMCNSSPKEISQDLNIIKKRMMNGETINITFWTGDVLVMKPPYNSPSWDKVARSFRQNPSWFSKVKLDKAMIHTKDDIASILTTTFNNITTEMYYKKSLSKTIKTFLIEEIGHGIGTVAERMWGFLTSIFGGFTKLVVFITFCSIIYIVVLIIRATMPNMFQKSRANYKKQTRFNIPETNAVDVPLRGYPENYERSAARRARKEISALLT